MLNLRTQLLPIAKGNAQHMREQAAKARTARDFKYANRIDRQAMKWSQLTVPEAPAKVYWLHVYRNNVCSPEAAKK